MARRKGRNRLGLREAGEIQERVYLNHSEAQRICK